MDCEGCAQGVGCLALCAEFEIVADEFAAHGMCTVVDDAVSTLHGVFVIPVIGNKSKGLNLRAGSTISVNHQVAWLGVIFGLRRRSVLDVRD